MAESAHVWFRRIDSESTLFENVQSVNRERDEWTSSVLASIPRESFSTTWDSREYTILYKYSKMSCENKILEMMKREPNIPAQVQAQSNLYSAISALKDLKTTRQSSALNKTRAETQSLLFAVGCFLRSFSGVVEVVKTADQQFGGLAYGTIMILAQVVISKQRREESIEDMFEELANAFPRLNRLQQVIKPNDSLRRLIVEVFELSIRFCRETVAYLTSRSWRRIMQAMSPNELKMQAASDLQTKLREIHKYCDILMVEEILHLRKDLYEMQIRLKDVEKTGKEVQHMGKDTNDRVRQNQLWLQNESTAQARTKFLLELKNVLKLQKSDCIDMSHTVEKVKTLLLEEFPSDEQDSNIGEKLSLSMLNRDAIFSRWLARSQSAILLLGGNNYNEDSSVQLNWLSDASVLAVKSMRGSRIVVSFFCQTELNLTAGPKQRSFQDIVHSLIYQLAEGHPEGLRSRQEEINDALASPKWENRNPIISYNHMKHLLETLLSDYEKGTSIMIIIDRLDRCRWNKDTIYNVELKQALSILLDIVLSRELRHLCIKILLVMDGDQAEVIAEHFSWAKGHRLDVRADWHQKGNEDEDY